MFQIKKCFPKSYEETHSSKELLNELAFSFEMDVSDVKQKLELSTTSLCGNAEYFTVFYCAEIQQ